MANIESAIAPDLRTDRIVPGNLPSDFTPPFEVYTSRYPPSMKELVFAIIGVQYSSPSLNDGAAMEKIISFTSSTAVPAELRPTLKEIAAVTDNRGYYNIATLAYWPDRKTWDRWSEETGFKGWWSGLDPTTQPNGWFLEVFFPTMERYETILTDTVMHEGASYMRNGVSGPILEHGYWGSMRDRLPAAQVDELDGEKAFLQAGGPKRPETLTSRIRVPGKRNLAVIRSGQDWKDTLPKERELYLGKMHPALQAGMDFLHDHGDEVGCYSNRFMDIVGPMGETGTDRSFGLGYFDCLASLEAWSKSHSTHVNIFAVFMAYVKEMDNNLSLRLYHEVSVLEPSQQLFEYVSCHSNTGMLSSIRDDI
ncbi:phenylacetaldoxime dehydratase [Geosmithia morbida]|uniref:Phenylacetaldoxime dehydratase n=1 Tax=Geosmithia morbida TaxID=1094350 RepID=A0A9P4YQS9_9HYPO|nr:phenylacetaldoxime dehydratase [Geosmithia morbida]KAF4120340.1 phenylacetaldoxime dehydratase [Geosmithia morbida]